MSIKKNGARGGALLMVMWLAAALAAIGFSVALMVRGEVERAATGLEGLRAYYLACGAVERGVNYLTYGPGPRDSLGRAQFWEAGQPVIRMAFPEGEAVVEVIPESSKLSVNTATREELGRLLMALGRPVEQARMVAEAILDWRGGGGMGRFDGRYLTGPSSFRAPHASFEQLEELMSVAGVTPELYYGGYARGAEGGLEARAGLRDCLTVYTQGTPMDANTAAPEVMIAVGVAPANAAQFEAYRRREPVLPAQWGAVSGQFFGPAAGRFRIGGDRIFTLRATARMRLGGRLSELRRTVAETVQIQSNNAPEGFRVLGWQENAAGRMLFDVWPN